MKRRIGLTALLCLIALGSQSTEAAQISFDKFVGLSNISDPDTSCTAPNSGFATGTCAERLVFNASPAPGVGFFFPRFNTTLGTLNSVRITYNLNTGGTWIGRPEDSFFSVSTDFEYSSLVGLYSDHFGDQSNVDSTHPIWNGVDDLSPGFIGGIDPLIAADIIDGGQTFGSFNSRQVQRTDSWSLMLSGTRDFSASDAFLYTPGVTPSSLQGNVQVLLLYQLFANLDGREADCGGLVPGACGTTNRVTSLRNAKITLTYDFDEPPPIVPIPATFWLFGSALALAGWVSRKRG